jgi:thioredoxin 1
MVVHEVDDLDDFEQLMDANADKYCIIDFHALWCAPCKKIKPFFAKYSEEFADTFTFVSINIDGDLSNFFMDIKDKHDIKTIPTFVIYKDNEVKHVLSDSNEENLKNFIIQSVNG